ncbi:hypothetical protein [Suipraeoptans intestinalis]|nr:hypothetical protein [Suipraeoptans intestinalis]
MLFTNALAGISFIPLEITTFSSVSFDPKAAAPSVVTESEAPLP